MASPIEDVSIPVPTPAVSQTHAKRKAVLASAICDLIVELPGIIPVANFAVRSSEARIAQKVDRGNAVPVIRIRYPQQGEDGSAVLTLIAADADVAQEPDPQAVQSAGVHRPNMLDHRKLGPVLIKQPTERVQSRLVRWGRLSEDLEEYLGSRS